MKVSNVIHYSWHMMLSKHISMLYPPWTETFLRNLYFSFASLFCCFFGMRIMTILESELYLNENNERMTIRNYLYLQIKSSSLLSTIHWCVSAQHNHESRQRCHSFSVPGFWEGAGEDHRVGLLQRGEDISHGEVITISAHTFDYYLYSLLL